MKHLEMIIAGFGGQGILSGGRIIARAAMFNDLNASWFPSYGPEMRGGTANCNVILSDGLIGSPIINSPGALVVLNGPSLEKFENEVIEGGIIVSDSSLVGKKVERKDVKSFEIPASEVAAEMGNKTFANIILLGKVIQETKITTIDSFEKALFKILPPKKHFMIPDEMKALEFGMKYKNADNLTCV